MKTEHTFIVGITGAPGSGKSAMADFFVSLGFKKVTLSSFLEEEAKKQKEVGKITRKILQDIGNQWRKKHGAGILAKKTLELLREAKIKNAVVDGIRNVEEINELRKNKRFVLIAIIAEPKIRFERLQKLKRRENLTWELFTKLDRRDRGMGQRKTGLQVTACQSLADFIIYNNGDKKEFLKKLRQLWQQLLFIYQT